ncbi:flagellar filament capping protein FliD [Acidicapsa dinghuensis]|uniref:Flagellar hook-associated protein 2 n=1 Tax=Acidicapsa dinghuensis TaxID=2218256 RepID=A0ABW1ELK6_9BACT|nr:flagellar filament capping protein FliD [Acidicapsa dinghuensis]
MGTVGISFGSPTAGTGFNVSNTVSQIVANLQNVETPWQNQLTTLEGQDSAISNLGTLLSNLSNDISQFTDFSGVLSTKEGSSSNPDVVALTSSSSSSVAGTHTIVVNSLATTASGYLDNVTNTNDTLTGSVTIQVGSGTAQTVDVGTDNTLSGLAASINNADIGVTASVVTDANGSRLSIVSGTSGATGNLTVTSAITDSSTGKALNYNSIQSGQNSSIVVDGVSVATSSNTVSTVIPGVTFQLLAPSTDTVQVQIVNSTPTVESAMEAFVSDFNAVVSAINTQESNNSSGSAQPLFGSPTLSLLQQQLLSSISGSSSSGYLAPISNASDTLSGTFSIAVGSGSATNFDLSSLSAGNQNLAGLAAAINAANLGVSAAVVTGSTGSSLSIVSQYGQAVTVNSSISDSITGSSLSYTSLGDVNNLAKLGISAQDDGTISLDSATFEQELNSDYSGVTAFFQDANSWGVDFSNTVNNLGTSSVTGTLALALSADSSIESSLNQNISAENQTISAEQTSLTLELTSADEILQAIPQNLDNINELYSAITGYQAPQQ